jgi:hypothetical protein
MSPKVIQQEFENIKNQLFQKKSGKRSGLNSQCMPRSKPIDPEPLVKFG